MGADTNIEWADHTFNPWWGCARVSPGCENCYAETWAKRFGVKWGVPAAGGVRRAQSDAYWDQPLKWDRAALRAGTRPRVFCASMADVFEDVESSVVIMGRARLQNLIRRTSHLDWLLLTKRPENFRAFLGPLLGERNVWLGVTAEDQQRADERIPLLLQTPAAVRFVSYEPALGPVDFANVRLAGGIVGIDALRGLGARNVVPRQRLDGRLNWVIAGAESGPGARPMNEDWVRSVRDQCAAAGVPLFYKQRVEGGRKVSLPVLDGHQHAEVPR